MKRKSIKVESITEGAAFEEKSGLVEITIVLSSALETNCSRWKKIRFYNKVIAMKSADNLLATSFRDLEVISSF